MLKRLVKWRCYKLITMKTILILLSLFISSVSFAQSNWPERPLKIIVPFAPGGSTDVIARVIAQGLTSKIGQPVIVENRPGAGGSIGLGAVSSAPNDGYTLLLYTSAISSQNSNETLDLVSLISESPEYLMVSPSLGVDSLAKFMVMYKSNPNKIVFGSIDGYSSSFINTVLLSKYLNIEPKQEKYMRGLGPMMVDLMSGNNIQAAFIPLAAAQAMGKKLLPLLSTANVRSSQVFSDVPAMSELSLKGFSNWTGLLAPRGMMQEKKNILRNALRAVMSDPNLIDRFNSMGQDIISLDELQSYKYIFSQRLFLTSNDFPTSMTSINVPIQSTDIKINNQANTAIENERKKLEEEKIQMAEERTKLDEERAKLEEERIRLNDAKTKKINTPSPQVQNSNAQKRQKCIQLGLAPGSADFQQCMN